MILEMWIDGIVIEVHLLLMKMVIEEVIIIEIMAKDEIEIEILRMIVDGSLK